MNGIEKIIAHIEADTASECQAIAAEASTACDEIKAQYEKAATEQYNSISSQGTADAALHIDRQRHVAVLEGKKQLLVTKQEMVSVTFAHAAQLLTKLPEMDYVSFLVRLATAASRSGTELIVLNKQDMARIGDTVCAMANDALAAEGQKSGLTLSDTPRDIRGGLILISGNIEVNCSIDTLLTQNKNELSSKVANILFN